MWLASFPRSGNTLLRAILSNCLGAPSTSVHGGGDLGGNPVLERYAGHRHPRERPPAGMPLLVKTHGRPPDAGRAIYLVRDGRAATASLWEFDGGRLPLRGVIAGGLGAGIWSEHLSAWRPWQRPDTLLLRYEDMVAELPAVLAALSGFLGLPVLRRELPDRLEIAAADGRWVRPPSDWGDKYGRRDMRLFLALNGDMLAALGYGPRRVDGGAGRGATAAVRALEVVGSVRYWRWRRRLRARRRLWFGRRRRA